MDQSVSQSPLTQPSSDASDEDIGRGEKMLHGFPRSHVTNLGGGTIGPVYLTRTQDGKVLFAEAQLYRAPFKHMVIDTPELLQMFKDPAQPVDFSVLNHPWPEFRLEPREVMKFDVARLERLQYVRSGNKIGQMVKGHPYASVMEVTPPAQAPRNKSQAAVASEVQIKRQSARNALKATEVAEAPEYIEPIKPIETTKPANPAEPTEPIGTTLPIITSQERPSPSSYVVSTALDSITRAAIQGEMYHLKEKIYNLLHDCEDKQTFDWVVSTGLKRQGKEGERFRNKIIDTLRELMRKQAARGGELQQLYNQYAEKQRRLERRWPYHLPHIDNFRV
ncbi:hypothetical protein BU23DRAFT_559186 [Bimuria novae-zelandiae CBS 107.79]|uniref:Uncharacterized protein n=1 Tax=Bimuria novae-zelandiae CBS 107.79 TaxID=1447943 RepID=A0A6A5USN3_9PLEO|nr:hypothetical protein BU23DRAFT_559186 [Bimuria novae-zelandiae CBS 107.79]